MNIQFRKALVATLLLMISSAGSLSAQEGKPLSNHYRWNIELGASMDFMQDKLPQFHHNKLGAGLQLELRYHVGQTPIDIGLYGNLSAVPRVHRTNFSSVVYNENHEPIGTVEGYSEGDVGFGAVNAMVTIGYNHQLGRHCEAFIGAGVGICSYNEGSKWEKLYDDGLIISTEEHGGTSLAFMPRAGIQMFDHLRLTAGYKFQEKGNRHAFVSVGFIIPFGH